MINGIDSVYCTSSSQIFRGENGEVTSNPFGEGVEQITEMYSSPKFVTESEFTSNSDWYSPAMTVQGVRDNWGGNGTWYNIEYKAITHNKWAKRGNNSDKAIVSRKQTHNILITYNHNGKNKTMKIPVYTEIRNCPKTQQ